ncbi:hypothetical protein Tco_0079787 [Tanacetum coccineum]
MGVTIGTLCSAKKYQKVRAFAIDALPPTLFADIDRDVRELYTRSGSVKDKIFSQFRARAGEGCSDFLGFVEAHRENHDLRMQFVEERRERLELAGWVGTQGHIPLGGLNPVNRTTKGLDDVECVRPFVVASRTGSYPDTRPICDSKVRKNYYVEEIVGKTIMLCETRSG